MLHISSSMETERLKLPGHSNKFVDAIKELIEYHFIKWASLVAQLVKNLPAMQETQVQFLVWEYPLEKEIATHSTVLAWRIPWTDEPVRLQSMGSQEWRQLRLNHYHHRM